MSGNFPLFSESLHPSSRRQDSKNDTFPTTNFRNTCFYITIIWNAHKYIWRTSEDNYWVTASSRIMSTWHPQFDIIICNIVRSWSGLLHYSLSMQFSVLHEISNYPVTYHIHITNDFPPPQTSNTQNITISSVLRYRVKNIVFISLVIVMSQYEVEHHSMQLLFGIKTYKILTVTKIVTHFVVRLWTLNLIYRSRSRGWWYGSRSTDPFQMWLNHLFIGLRTAQLQDQLQRGKYSIRSSQEYLMLEGDDVSIKRALKLRLALWG